MGLAAQRFSSGNVSFGTPTAKASYFRPVEALRRARRSDCALNVGKYMLAYAPPRTEKLVALQGSTHWAGQVTPALLAALARRCAATTGGAALHQVPQTSRTANREHWAAVLVWLCALAASSGRTREPSPESFDDWIKAHKTTGQLVAVKP